MILRAMCILYKQLTLKYRVVNFVPGKLSMADFIHCTELIQIKNLKGNSSLCLLCLPSLLYHDIQCFLCNYVASLLRMSYIDLFVMHSQFPCLPTLTHVSSYLSLLCLSGHLCLCLPILLSLSVVCYGYVSPAQSAMHT